MDKILEKLIGSERHCSAYVVEKKTDIENRRMTFCINKEVIDRHNEIVTQDAIIESINKDFCKCPICLACHQHVLSDGTPPSVGRWDCATVAKQGLKTLLDLIFSTGKLGDMYFLEYKEGNMCAVSIGFRVLEAHVEVVNGKNIYVITKIELYEISCVAVGANREALAKKGINLQDEPDFKSAVHEAVKEALKPLEKNIKEFLEEKFMELNVLGFGKQSDQDLDSEFADEDEIAGKDLGADDEDGDLWKAFQNL